ncbi:MAG: hypothetical protein J0H60_15230, partial [Rhizobiales bacterium]|nr:hypothetical protein [Hyphomicrobiales bacterium]
GAAVWLSELTWRDFYFMILHHHPRVTAKAFKPEYDAIKWEQGKGNWWIIVPTTADQLKALPDFDPQPYQPEPAESDATDTGTSGGTGMGTSGMSAPSTTSPSTGDSDG